MIDFQHLTVRDLLRALSCGMHRTFKRIFLIVGYLVFAGLMTMPDHTLLVFKAFSRIDVQDQAQLIRQAIILLIVVAVLPECVRWFRAHWTAQATKTEDGGTK